MVKLVCFNNKCRRGHGYLKDATFNLTIGKVYEFKNQKVYMESNISMLDDDGEIIDVYIIRNHFETIEENRDRKLNELGI
jgi:hypothetical protein